MATEHTATGDAEEDADEWEDAYARHFSLVLTSVALEREDFRALFSEDELAVAHTFLSTLSPFHQQLYARLFQRRGPWFKTTSLLRYFMRDNGGEERSELPDQTLVRVTIDALVNAGFLRTLSGISTPKLQCKGQEASDMEAALDAIQQCASAPELAALHKTLSGSNGSGKAKVFQAVKRLVTTQRRIDGSRIPVARLMQRVWLDSYPLPGKKSSDVMVVQMAEGVHDLLLRMHRLFYFVSSAPFAASTILPPSMKDMGELMTMATLKIRQEPTQWPGLMVFFKKVEYPTYKVAGTSSTNETAANSESRRLRVFPSSEFYVCYEVACQLRQLMGLVEQCLAIETPEKEYQEPDLELKWILSDTPPVFVAFRRLLALLFEDQEDDSGCLLMEPPGAMETGGDDAKGWQMQSWEQFYHELNRMQSLDDLVLASRSCLHAYLKWMKAATPVKNHLDPTSSSNVPVFLSKCNAGYHLARVLHTAVGLYEKLRKYQLASILLNELLAAPFLERKRGYWWDRLALNLEHLKSTDQARTTCLNALEDPRVLEADRIALERRLKRLQRLSNKKAQAFEAESSAIDSFLRPQATELDEKEQENVEQEEVAEPIVKSSTYEFTQNCIVGRPLNRQMGTKSRFIGYDDEPCNVEQLVMQYYRDHVTQEVDANTAGIIGGWYGLHAEGVVLGNLFGILIWDVLYADVPGVFQTPFQSSPLDFGYADVFYESRRALIESRLLDVAERWTMSKLLSEFATTWDREYGKLTRFISWPKGAEASLLFHLLSVIAMGRSQLARLLRYMATSKEFHQAQNGLPDLLLLQIQPSRVTGDGVSKSESLVLDNHGCLDVHAFCGFDRQLNLNEKAEEEAVLVDNDEPVSPLQRALPFLEKADWKVSMKLVEVKGPRDRLSDKQLLWLQLLNENIGLDASVMHVVEEEKHVERKRKRKQSTKKSTAPSRGGNKSATDKQATRRKQ